MEGFAQLHSLAPLCPRKQHGLPNEQGGVWVSCQLIWKYFEKRNLCNPPGQRNLHHPAHSLFTKSTTLFEIPSADGLTSHWIITKHSLQLQTTQTNARQDTAAASRHCKGTAHNKLNGLRLFKVVLKSGQNSQYYEFFLWSPSKTFQITEWFLLLSLTARNEVRDLWQATPFMTTRQTTTYTAKYRLQAY